MYNTALKSVCLLVLSFVLFFVVVAIVGFGCICGIFFCVVHDRAISTTANRYFARALMWTRSSVVMYFYFYHFTSIVFAFFANALPLTAAREKKTIKCQTRFEFMNLYFYDYSSKMRINHATHIKRVCVCAHVRSWHLRTMMTVFLLFHFTCFSRCDCHRVCFVWAIARNWSMRS